MYDVAERLTVTVPEAARMLGVGQTTVYELIRQGELPAIKLNNRRLIARAVIEAIVRGENVRPSPATSATDGGMKHGR